MLNQKINRFWYALAALMLMVPLYVFTGAVLAAELKHRSIVVGTTVVSAVTSHRYNFQITSSISVGSLEIEYCTNSPLVGASCTAPSGLSLDAAAMGTQTGLTGFTIHPSTTANKLILTRPAAGVTPTVNASLTVNNITNPGTPNQTVFVRISTFASTNASGIRGDKGTVAFSTTRQLKVNGFVPPYLTFCVGNTVANDCSSAVGNYLSFGELSSNTTSAVSSQFAVATNDYTGYFTTITGITLTSGNNTISANSSPSPSIPGTSQFGLNLRANSNPQIGAEKSGVGSGTASSEFNTPNVFTFKPGTLASSTKSTDFNVFTVSYIANIVPGQAPGVYSSTITFITTVSF